MKKILTLIALLFITIVNAQQATRRIANGKEIITNPNYNNFKHLNVNNVKTGILSDYGHSKTNIKVFDGVLRNKNYTNMRVVSDIYNTIISATVKRKNRLNNTNAMQQWQRLRKENTITLGGVLFNYNSISSTAIKNGNMQVVDSRTNRVVHPNRVRRLSSNHGVFKESPKVKRMATAIQRSNSLYTTSNCFAMAPSINNIAFSSFKVAFPKKAFATNLSSQIRAIYVNFGDYRGYQRLYYDRNLRVNYRRKGNYTWVFKIVLKNGKTLYSRSLVKVTKMFNPNISRRTNTITNGTKIYVNGRYKGMLEIHDTNGSGITKPLIIAEGLDTGIITSPEIPQGENNIDSFEGFTEDLTDSNSNILHSKLFGNEYDLIYINWANGLDYIENNAEVLKEVIRMVNRAKRASGSNAKNVVLGQSMGGLIARYALKDMEDKGENHETGLYISHDAPHQGANAPISVQYLFRHIRKVYIRNPLVYLAGEYVVPMFNNGLGGSDYYNIINNPAIRQMSINWVNKYYHIDNSMHRAWQNKLKAKGYPKNTRNIAIANGNVCGNFQNLERSILWIYKDMGITYLEDVVSGLLGYQNLRLDHMFLSKIPGPARYKFAVDCKPVIRYGSGKQIYSGLISYRKKIFWLLPVTIHLTNKKLNQPHGLLPYDELPGSNFSLSQGALPSFLRNIVNQRPSSFIPNISALDYGKGNINHKLSVYENVIYRNNNKIPFDDYILERGNRQHITFSADNSQWLVEELDGQKNHPNNNLALFCTKDKKITPNKETLCSGTQVFKSNFNAPRFEWSIIQGRNLITNISDNRQKHFKFDTKNSSGLLRIRLRFGDANFNRIEQITKSVWIGRPNTSHFKISKIGSCYEPIKTITSNAKMGINQWKYTYNGKTYYNTYIDAIELGLKDGQGTGISLYARNSCGWSSPKRIHIYKPTLCDCGYSSPSCGDGIGHPTPLSANHSKPNNINCDEVKIKRKYATYRIVITPCDNSTQTYEFRSNRHEFETVVSNKYGTEILRTNERKFSLENYPNDYYFINITRNGQLFFRDKIYKN